MDKNIVVKISFVRDMTQIAQLCNTNIDYLAFDFCANSDRFFAQKNRAATFEIPRKIKRVGIFDSSQELHIISIAGQLELNSVQMDGQQSPQLCEKIASEGLEIIKTFTPNDIENINSFEGVCNKFILRGFDLNQILSVNTQTPFIVEGDMQLFEKLMMAKCPNALAGFDTGCGFEEKMALKDINLVEKLINLKA